jgi:hypothetical protein
LIASVVFISETFHRLSYLLILLLWLFIGHWGILISQNWWFHIGFLSWWWEYCLFLLSLSLSKRQRWLILSLLIRWRESFRIRDHLIISVKEFILLEIVIAQEDFIIFIVLKTVFSLFSCLWNRISWLRCPTDSSGTIWSSWDSIGNLWRIFNLRLFSFDKRSGYRLL